MSNASQCHFLLLATEETERLPRWGRNNRDCDEPGIPGWVTFLVLLLGLLRLRPTGGRLGGGGNWGRVWVGEQPSNKCLRCPSLIHTLPRPPHKNECTHTHTHTHTRTHTLMHSCTRKHTQTHTPKDIQSTHLLHGATSTKDGVFVVVENLVPRKNGDSTIVKQTFHSFYGQARNWPAVWLMKTFCERFNFEDLFRVPNSNIGLQSLK